VEGETELLMEPGHLHRGGRLAPVTAWLGLATLLLTAWAGIAIEAERAPVSKGPPTVTTGADGAIVALTMIVRTATSEYFALTYWSDGLRVKGFLGWPRHGNRLPAVIFNRGGNGEFGELWAQQLIPFVEAGYVAVGSQYRGNCGGEGYEEFGGADVDDVLNLVTLLLNLPEVDPQRIAMFGGSRGGMMTYLALKQETLRGSHHIKVAATVGGLADITRSLWEQTGLMPTLVALIGKGPIEAPNEYQDRSAVLWPDLINAPLLILHGEDDVQVPVEQSMQLADLLAKAGKMVKLVTYPADDHGLSAHRAGYPDVLTWFDHYLGKPGEDLSFETHEHAMREVSRTWP
jgi:dipeptidyl aminopeptidase/acylaminoacyl peptidase